MKKIFILIFTIALCSSSFAQDNKNDDDRKGKFNMNNMFIGGGLNLGAGSGMFQLGVTPEVGYSLTKWLDAGVLFIVNYQSQNNFYDVDPSTGAYYGPFKIHNFNYGTGGIIRIWPFHFLHLTAQPEFNWIKSTQTYEPTGQKGTYTFKSSSFLVGIGYGSRNVGSSYQYLTLMTDLMSDTYSPYRDQYGKSRLVIKAGFGLYLRSKKR